MDQGAVFPLNAAAGFFCVQRRTIVFLHAGPEKVAGASCPFQEGLEDSTSNDALGIAELLLKVAGCSCHFLLTQAA